MSGTTLKKNSNHRIQWCPEMENMLLDLWEEKIEDLRGTRKNSHIYQEMAAYMQQCGFLGNWADIRTKMDNLTRKYKQEKNKIGPTGGAPSGWCHYNKMHSILGSYKVHNIELLMHESTNMSTLTEDLIEFDQDTSCSTQQLDLSEEQSQPPKKRKTDTNSELVRLAQERMEMQRQQHEERKEQASEILKRLENISSQNATFQMQLLDILRGKK